MKTGSPNGVSRNHAFDRWFRYPAGFSPDTLTRAFEAVGGAKGRIVVDPFCGAGTVGTRTLEGGGEFRGIDAHPLMVRLARMKLLQPAAPPEELRRIGDQIAFAPSVSGSNETELVRRCFDPEVLDVLCGLRAAINGRTSWRPHLTWALLATLRDVATSKVGWPYQRPGAPRKPVHRDPRDRFRARVRLMADDIENAGIRMAGRVLLGDSRNSEPWRKLFASDQAASCITSPPYLNNFDYADATRLEVYFLGQATSWRELCDSVRSRMMVATTQQSRVAAAKRDAHRLTAIPEIHRTVTRLTQDLAKQRAERPRGKEYDRVVPSYFAGIYSVLAQLRRRLAVGGSAAWIVGDSAPYGIHIDTPHLIEVLASHVGFTALGSETLRQRGMRWHQNGSRHQIPLEEKLVLLECRK